MGEPMWKTSDGREMPVADMSDRHINNALRKCVHGHLADMLRAEQARRKVAAAVRPVDLNSETVRDEVVRRKRGRRKSTATKVGYAITVNGLHQMDTDQLADFRAELVKKIDTIDHLLIDKINQEAESREAYANVDLDAADAAMDELDAVLG